MDSSELAKTVVDFIRPHFLLAAGDLTDDFLAVPRKVLFEWLKARFSKPLQVTALEHLERTPNDEDVVDNVASQLQRQLDKDAEFKDGVISRLPMELRKVQITQHAGVTGDRNTFIQLGDGRHATFNIGGSISAKNSSNALSDDAIRLLREVSREMCPDSPTYDDYIDSENLPFVDPADARSVARWRSALNELVVNDLIERYDAIDRHFGVTKDGFRLLERLPIA
jgi:hypothetical protein